MKESNFMKMKIGNKRVVIDLKRLFISITIVTLIVMCIAVPTEEYIINEKKPNVPEDNSIQTADIQPDQKTDVQASEQPSVPEVSPSEPVNVQPDHSKDVSTFQDKPNISETNTSPTADVLPDQTEDIQALDDLEEVISDTGDVVNPSVNQKFESSEDYQVIFQNDLFFGDSITEGLSFYEYIDEHDVIAKPGLTLTKAEKELDKIAGLQPHNVYMMFGANDIDGVLTDERFIETIQHPLLS